MHLNEKSLYISKFLKKGEAALFFTLQISLVIALVVENRMFISASPFNAVMFWLKYMKKIWSHKDMVKEKGGLF